jgi:hypothetical protein
MAGDGRTLQTVTGVGRTLQTMAGGGHDIAGGGRRGQMTASGDALVASMFPLLREFRSRRQTNAMFEDIFGIPEPWSALLPSSSYGGVLVRTKDRVCVLLILGWSLQKKTARSTSKTRRQMLIVVWCLQQSWLRTMTAAAIQLTLMAWALGVLDILSYSLTLLVWVLGVLSILSCTLTLLAWVLARSAM